MCCPYYKPLVDIVGRQKKGFDWSSYGLCTAEAEIIQDNKGPVFFECEIVTPTKCQTCPIYRKMLKGGERNDI